MTGTRFADLPRITDHDDLLRVHRTDGLYYVKRGGTAHAILDCTHLEPDGMIDSPTWRVASATECRTLGIGWCTDCC